MKKTLFFMMFATFGLISFSGCDKGVNKAVNPPVEPDHVSIATNITLVNSYTYSLSNPPSDPRLILGLIGFSVSVVKDNSGLSISHSDITWTGTGDNVGTLSPVPTGTGAFLILNNTLGTMIVKVTYLDGTIDEMSKTVTIHVVA